MYSTFYSITWYNYNKNNASSVFLIQTFSVISYVFVEKQVNARDSRRP